MQQVRETQPIRPGWLASHVPAARGTSLGGHPGHGRAQGWRRSGPQGRPTHAADAIGFAAESRGAARRSITANRRKNEIQLPLSASCLPIKLQMFRVRVSDSWAFFGPAKRRPRRRLRGLGKLSPCGASAARVHSAPTGSLGAPADTQASGRAARRSGRCIAARRHAGSVASTTVRHRGTASPSPRSSCPAAQFAARSSYSPRTAVSTNACVRRGSP